jgi:hypothetical protein
MSDNDNNPICLFIKALRQSSNGKLEKQQNIQT